MSSSSTATNPNVFPLPPPGLNYIESIRPSLNMIIIGTIWSSILLPLLITLFFFSTKELRRKPIFLFNVIAILLGLIMGVLNLVAEIRAILKPEVIAPASERIAFSFLVFFIPFFVESILVFRIMAVYPRRQTSQSIWLSIFIPLLLLKLARLVNIIYFVVNYARVTHAQANPIEASQLAWRSYPGQKIEWFLQLVDNTAASGLFLYRLNQGRTLAERMTGGFRKGTYIARLKGLFWIATSNFVLPVILCLIQLIFIFRDPSFLTASYIFLTNDYVEIIGVLLATVWTAGSHWSSNSSNQSTVYSERSTFRTVGFKTVNREIQNSGDIVLSSMDSDSSTIGVKSKKHAS